MSSWRAGPVGLARCVSLCPAPSWAQNGSQQTSIGRGSREERRRKCHLGKGFLDNPPLYDQPYLSFSSRVKPPLLWQEWRAEVKLPDILPSNVSFQSGPTLPRSNPGPGQRDSGRAWPLGITFWKLWFLFLLEMKLSREFNGQNVTFAQKLTAICSFLWLPY